MISPFKKQHYISCISRDCESSALLICILAVQFTIPPLNPSNLKYKNVLKQKDDDTFSCGPSVTKRSTQVAPSNGTRNFNREPSFRTHEHVLLILCPMASTNNASVLNGCDVSVKLSRSIRCLSRRSEIYVKSITSSTHRAVLLYLIRVTKPSENSDFRSCTCQY